MTELTLESKLSKIQNLMARATGTNHEAEAQTCFLKAQELMAKWNIESSQLEEKNEEGKEVVREVVMEAGAIKVSWKAALAKIIADNFRCKFFFGGKGSSRYIIFFGVKEDTQIAKELYIKALTCIKKGQDRIVHRYLRSGQSSFGIAGDYALGFLQGLKDAFANQVDEQGWGLVVCTPKEVNEAYENIEWKGSDWKTTPTGRRGDSEVFETGRLDGKDLIPSKKKKFLEAGEVTN